MVSFCLRSSGRTRIRLLVQHRGRLVLSERDLDMESRRNAVLGGENRGLVCGSSGVLQAACCETPYAAV